MKKQDFGRPSVHLTTDVEIAIHSFQMIAMR